MKPPIADPFEEGALEEEVARFHYHFWKTYLFCFILSLVMAGPTCLYILSQLYESDSQLMRASISRIGLAFSLLFLIVPLLCTVCYFLSPVKAGTTSLRCTNFWGVMRQVEWAQINEVHRPKIPFPYLIISTAEKHNVLWLPLILGDMAGFTRIVEKYTTENNPLRLFLKQRGQDEP
jgi:hypothetical protein